MARLHGSVSKITAEKIALFEKEIVIPLILEVMAAPIGHKIPFKLYIVRENRKRYSVGALAKFNSIFTISRHGRNAYTGESWPTKISMNLMQFINARKLLEDHGYDLDKVFISTHILEKNIISLDINEFDAARIQRGLS